MMCQGSGHLSGTAVQGDDFKGMSGLLNLGQVWCFDLLVEIF